MRTDEERRREIVRADIEAGRIEKESRCACTKDAWKKRGIFATKNIVALGAGLATSIAIRAILSDNNKSDPMILGKSSNTLYAVSDLTGSVLTLILCSAWVRPSPTHFTDIICSPVPLYRSLARNTMPLLLGIIAMFLAKLICYKIPSLDPIIHDANNNRILEISDFAAGFILLVTFHIIDAILERCWPADIGEGRPLRKNVNASSYGATSTFSTRGKLDHVETPEIYRQVDSSDNESSYVF